jgi:hypothetical protein
LFAIYRDFVGSAADADDCAEYAEEIGNPSFPVFADGATNFSSSQIYNATPVEIAHPVACALAPNMEIIACAEGHGVVEPLLEEIKTHAGL